MKLSSANTSIVSPFQMVKQTNSLATTDESLIYSFPIVIDKQLQKEWGNLIRDFFTIQILSQIKSANILNITSSVASLNKVENIDTSYVNPSDQLFNTLQGGGNNNINVAPGTNQYFSAMAALNQRQLSNQNRGEIQQQLDSFHSFIANQIKNDPAYENLRPVATPIVIENFVNIPLIVGTKEIKIDSQAIYWILFLCLADNRELTSESTIKVIKDYIRRIPKEKYLQILSSNSLIDQKDLTDSHSPTNRSAVRINELIEDSVDKNFRNIQAIFNEKRWLEEVGIGRESGNVLQISTSQLDIRAFQADVMVRFSNLFMGFMNRDLLRIIQSLVYVLVPTNSEGIDLTRKYGTLIDDLISLSKSNDTNNLLMGITAALYGATESEVSDSAEASIAKIESFCGDMNKISVKETFDNIHKIRMEVTNLRYSELLKFMDEFSMNTNNLLTTTKIIKNFISDISNNVVSSSDYDLIDRKIFDIIRNFFEDTSFGPDQTIFNPAGPIPPIFNTLTHINDLGRARNFFATCYNNLTEFTLFCYYYSFMGHICEYFKELKIKIDVKRKNALSFPNYVMVIPVEYVISLYNAMSYRRVSEMLVTDQAIPSKFQDFKPTENDISGMLRVLNERLKIPHIVVIDRKSKTIYYKWNYLNRAFKMNESSISNYIRSQRNFIQIF